MRLGYLFLLVLLVSGCQKAKDSKVVSASPAAAAAEVATPAPVGEPSKAEKETEKVPGNAPVEAAVAPAKADESDKADKAPEDGVKAVGATQGACGANVAGATEDGVAPAEGNCGVAGTAQASAEKSDAEVTKQHFGGTFTLEDSMSLASLLDKSDTFTGKNIKVRGYISRVCKKKGCWFVVTTGADDEDSFVRITMKDYGFFVPLDCDGKTAIIEGVFTQREVAEAMRKHLAKDGGEDPAKVKGTKKEFTMVATAIDIEG